MTDLQQDLEELSATLPSLPERVRELLQDAQGLSAAATNLEADVRAARSDLARSLAALQEACPRMETRLTSLRETLVSSLHGSTQAFETARAELDDAVDDVERAVDAADVSRLELQRGLPDWAARATAAGVTMATLDLVRGSQDAATHLQAAAGAVGDKTTHLRSALEELLPALTNDAMTLEARLREIATAVKGSAAFLAGEEMYHRLGDDSASRRVAADEVQSRADALVSALEERLVSAVTRPLDVAAGRVGAAATEWSAAAGAHALALSEARRALLEGLDAIGDATAPLPDVYQQVEDTARRIGQP